MRLYVVNVHLTAVAGPFDNRREATEAMDGLEKFWGVDHYIRSRTELVKVRNNVGCRAYPPGLEGEESLDQDIARSREDLDQERAWGTEMEGGKGR